MHFECKCGSVNRVASILEGNRRDLTVYEKKLRYDDFLQGSLPTSPLEEGFYCAGCLEKITDYSITELLKILR